MKKSSAVVAPPADIWAVNPHKKKLSPSAISDYLTCPRKFKFGRVDRIKTPPSAVMIQSSAWHACVENNYNFKMNAGKGKDLKLSVMLDLYRKEFANKMSECDVCRKPKVGCLETDHKYRAIQVVYDDFETYETTLALGLRITEMHHLSIAPSIKPLAVEEKFLVPLNDDIDIIGVLDVRGDGWIADNKSKGKTPAQNDFDKDIQFSIYAWAYWKKYKKIPKLYMHLIVRNKELKATILETSRTKTQLMWMETQMAEVGAAIRAGVFFPNMGGYLCSQKWCGFWDRCQNGKA